MTKVTILGQEPTEHKELKKIEFVKLIGYDGKLHKATLSPDFYDNIKLMAKGYMDGSLDTFYAWDSNPNDGHHYLGHFNDGVV